MKPQTSKARTVIAFLAVFLLAMSLAIFLRAPWREWPRVPGLQLPSALELAALPTATGFDYPLGNRDGALAYNAQPFTENRHLGDDLNGIGGENSDLGDPVYAIADGRVLLATEGGPGWGNVLILLHAYDEGGTRRYLQSFYAHLDAFKVAPGAVVRRGQEIATVGNAHGKYLAHLHLELREFLTPYIGPGYRAETSGWLNPSGFIAGHRPANRD